MSYTERLIVSIQPDLLDIGRRITRALDVDVGGAESWTPVRFTGDPEAPPDSYVADTPCTPEFAAQATAMLQDPVMLHAVISADYASRWADLVPPTLAECEAFCAGAVVSDTTATPAEPTPPAP